MELEQCSSSLLELSGVMDDSVSSLKHRMSNQQKGNTKMNNKHISLAALVAIPALHVSAAVVVPRVDENTVSISQSRDRIVTVAYTLTQTSGVITVDFQTNAVVNGKTVWTSIGAENFRNVGGAVNCIVSELGVEQHITWRPDVTWGGHKIIDGLRAVVKAWALDDPPPYLAINLAVDDFVAFYPCADAIPGGITNDMYKTDWLLMRRIPAANVVWRMGSPLGEIGKNYDDSNNVRETPHLVRLSSDYYMAVYETTACQYERARRGSSVSISGQSALLPKVEISWNDIRGNGATGGAYEWPAKGSAVSSSSVLGIMRDRWPAVGTFDLPTEAQWEYACRAGCGSALYNGTELDGYAGTTSSNIIAVVGWCMGIANTRQPVGTKQPNNWGLFDMIGNVEELCLDWWAQQNTSGVEVYVPGKIYDDPVGPASDLTGSKSCRGGSVYANTANVRCAARSSRMAVSTTSNSVGFRICCPITLSAE